MFEMPPASLGGNALWSRCFSTTMFLMMNRTRPGRYEKCVCLSWNMAPKFVSANATNVTVDAFGCSTRGWLSLTDACSSQGVPTAPPTRVLDLKRTLQRIASLKEEPISLTISFGCRPLNIFYGCQKRSNITVKGTEDPVVETSVDETMDQDIMAEYTGLTRTPGDK